MFEQFFALESAVFLSAFNGRNGLEDLMVNAGFSMHCSHPSQPLKGSASREEVDV